MRCWDSAPCTRNCIEPCQPPATIVLRDYTRRGTLDQVETLCAMAPTNLFFDDDDPRRVLKAPEPPPFDWRRLLKLYMAAVVHAEGVSFVDGISVDDLTDAERAAILEVEAEVKRENPRDNLG